MAFASNDSRYMISINLWTFVMSNYFKTANPSILVLSFQKFVVLKVFLISECRLLMSHFICSSELRLFWTEMQDYCRFGSWNGHWKSAENGYNCIVGLKLAVVFLLIVFLN